MNYSTSALIKEHNKQAVKNASATVSGGLFLLFINPAIFYWMMPVLIPIVPALAPLGALTYWNWFGLLWLFSWFCGQLGKIFHNK